VKTPQEHAAALHDHLAHNSLVWGEVVLKVEQVIAAAMADARAAALNDVLDQLRDMKLQQRKIGTKEAHAWSLALGYAELSIATNLDTPELRALAKGDGTGGGE
jgi:hypothetical protein